MSLEGDILQRKVRDLVRLALCTEHKRQALKREDVLRRVMADHPKALAQVFEAAQEQLRQVFGMELAPVGTRSRQTAGRSGNTANSNQNRADHQAQQFILRSVIPGELAAACVPQPRTAEHGLLMLILTLIFVNADQLADDTLTAYLRRFQFTPDLKGNRIHPDFGSLETLLNQWSKQGYLDKAKQTVGDRVTFQWSWGPRARVEFPEDNVKSFIFEIYGNDVDDRLRKAVDRAAEGQ